MWQPVGQAPDTPVGKRLDTLPSAAAPSINLAESPESPVDGYPEPGDTLTPSAVTWSNGGTTSTYHWLRCDFEDQQDCTLARPASATASYVLSEIDVGRRMRVFLTGSNLSGTGVTPLSGSTNLIFPPAPRNLGLPVIVGEPYAGESLVGSAGTLRRQAVRPRQHPSGSRSRATPNSLNQKPDPVYALSAPSGVIVERPPDPVDPGTVPPGGTPPGGAVPDTVKPVVSVFKTARSIRRGAPIRFVVTLSEMASATITIHRLRKGRKKGGKCVKPTRKLRKAKRCTRATRTGRPTAFGTLRAGLSNLDIPSKKLRPGRYRATIVVRDAAGNVSAKRRATFKTKRR